MMCKLRVPPHRDAPYYRANIIGLLLSYEVDLMVELINTVSYL